MLLSRCSLTWRQIAQSWLHQSPIIVSKQAGATDQPGGNEGGPSSGPASGSLATIVLTRNRVTLEVTCISFSLVTKAVVVFATSLMLCTKVKRTRKGREIIFRSYIIGSTFILFRHPAGHGLAIRLPHVVCGCVVVHGNPALLGGSSVATTEGLIHITRPLV